MDVRSTGIIGRASAVRINYRKWVEPSIDTTDPSHSRNGNVLFKLSSLNDFPLYDGPVGSNGQFQQRLDNFYVTDSPLLVTNIAKLAMF